VARGRQRGRPEGALGSPLLSHGALKFKEGYEASGPAHVAGETRDARGLASSRARVPLNLPSPSPCSPPSPYPWPHCLRVCHVSPRQTFVDVPLEDGSVIPAGSDILIPFLPLFRSGIANPDDFIPERWVDEGNPDSERLAQLYIPFALGKRNCAGQNLAMLELR